MREAKETEKERNKSKREERGGKEGNKLELGVVHAQRYIRPITILRQNKNERKKEKKKKIIKRPGPPSRVKDSFEYPKAQSVRPPRAFLFRDNCALVLSNVPRDSFMFRTKFRCFPFARLSDKSGYTTG